MSPAAPVPVTVAAADAAARAELARYLEGAGFAVHAGARPPAPRAPAGSLVWVTDDDDAPADVVRALAAWLRAAPRGHVVVVTWHLAALRPAVEALGPRALALPAPVFGWTVVDALRGRADLR